MVKKEYKIYQLFGEAFRLLLQDRIVEKHLWHAEENLFLTDNVQIADPGGRAVLGVVLRPLVCWDCGYEYRWEYGCLSLLSVVCCQVEVSDSG